MEAKAPDGIYVYVVYLPGDRIATVGAWEDFDTAVEWTGGDYEEGNTPVGPGLKKYRIAQVPITRKAGVYPSSRARLPRANDVD